MALIQRLSRRVRLRRRSEPAPDTPPPVQQPSRSRQIHVAVDTSRTAVREAIIFIKNSSDALPPLKSVAGGLDGILTMIEVCNIQGDIP